MKNLYLFNPENEMSIANGTPSYMPPANIMLMVNDLSFLPAYFADQEDYVLLAKHPGAAFMQSRNTIFGMKDITVTWQEVERLSLHEIRPWGWSPRIHSLLSGLKSRCSEAFQHGVMAEWKEERRELYSRRKTMECLERIQDLVPDMDKAIIPRVCVSMEAIRVASEAGGIVVKAPWSSSGRGLQFIREGEMMRKEEEILSGILRRQGYVMVEKKLERVLDFAMEFEIDSRYEVTFSGLSVFNTGKRGEYEGNWVAPRSAMEKRIAAYVGMARLEEIREQVSRVLGDLFHAQYVGCLGVDMMIYKDDEGRFRVQPCVEINLRYNMGILSLGLQRYLMGEAEGNFNIRFSGKPGDIQYSVSENQRAFPLKIREGKIVSGYVNLTPVFPDTRFVAELLVER